MELKITPSVQTIVKLTAPGPVANTDTKLLIYGLFQKGRVLAQDGDTTRSRPRPVTPISPTIPSRPPPTGSRVYGLTTGGRLCGSLGLIYLNAVNGAASQIGQGAERRDDLLSDKPNSSSIASFVLHAGHE